MRGPTTLNIAHRGASALWPENTLDAFDAAMRSGCDGLEIDVQLTADQAAVIHHDFRPNPEFTRDGSGAWIEGRRRRLAAMTAAEIAALRIGRPRPGSAYAAAHPHLRPVDAHVPSLDEALALFVQRAGPEHRLLLELKHPTDRSGGSAEPLVRVVAEHLTRHQLGDRLRLVGFDWRALALARAAMPGARRWHTTYPQTWFRPGARPSEPPSRRKLERMRTLYAAGAPWMNGFWPERYDASIPDALAAAGADGWLVYGPDVSDDEVRRALDLGLEVGVWGVNDEGSMVRFLDLAVTAICTDRPDRLARCSGRPWTPPPPSGEIQ